MKYSIIIIMIRRLDNKKDQELLDCILKYNDLLKESFLKKDKSNLKITIPKLDTNELLKVTELKLCLEALKHNYKQLIKYIEYEEYTPELKLIYLSNEQSYPIHIKMNLNDYLKFGFYISKKELLYKKNY